jgi:hypothetical protein
MEVATTKCSELNHREFRIEFESAIPRVDVNLLICFLEQSVQKGTHYGEGQIIEFGSMILRLVAAEEYLDIYEPDLIGFPIAWTKGATQSLKLLRLQKDIAESVGFENDIDFPSIRHSLLFGADLSKEANAFVLERFRPMGTDSGWFIGRYGSQLDYNDPTKLQRVSVYQAILNWPRVAGFLALPAGVYVKLSSEVFEVSRYKMLREIRKGSFLDVGIY